MLVLGVMLLICVGSVSATTVSVENKTVRSGDTFWVNVTCYPTEPVKAFECVFTYNTLLIKCEKIEMGDFFDSYNTFPNTGNISNEKGEVKDIYNLIVGQGNISTNGVLFRASFAAIDNGTNYINLTLKLTNETMYIPVEINNGIITVLNSLDDEEPADSDTDNTSPPMDMTFVIYILVAIAAVILVIMIFGRRKQNRW